MACLQLVDERLPDATPAQDPHAACADEGVAPAPGRRNKRTWQEVYGLLVEGHDPDWIGLHLRLKPSRLRAILRGPRLRQALRQRQELLLEFSREQLGLQAGQAMGAMSQLLSARNSESKRKAALYVINLAQEQLAQDEQAAAGCHGHAQCRPVSTAPNPAMTPARKRADPAAILPNSSEFFRDGPAGNSPISLTGKGLKQEGRDRDSAVLETLVNTLALLPESDWPDVMAAVTGRQPCGTGGHGAETRNI